MITKEIDGKKYKLVDETDIFLMGVPECSLVIQKVGFYRPLSMISGDVLTTDLETKKAQIWRPFLDHVEYKCSPTCEGCQFCEGGLFACTVCGGIEGSLLDECPGRRLTIEENDRNYTANLKRWDEEFKRYQAEKNASVA